LYTILHVVLYLFTEYI